ncbi:ABC transporter ATP-binding protein [Rhodococcoides fascians A21d2]|uniref:ABC transporter ATP-binding protein n=1 Tax=Rhodococcoides fascians TaxID=1828 RepID=UPI0006901027|nr:ABC transporter ATP-binding protein [Rhodococcus fascians]QIH99941.1 ABC transporter ATP-binding protein [Rhodococcus fascians A21d2]
MKLPIFFDAPPTPLALRDIEIDQTTTPRQLTLRTMFGAKRYTVPAGILLITHQLCAALVPVIMGVAVDRAISTGDPQQLVLWVAVLAVDFAFMSMTFRFGGRIGFLGMNAIQHRIRTRVTDRILDSRGMAGPARQPGMLLSIATSDARQLATSVAIGIYPLGEFAAVLFAALILLFISWPLGLAIAIAAPLMLWLMDRAGAPLRRRSGHEQQLAGEAAGTAADLVGGFRTVKGLGAEPEAAGRYRAASERALEGTLRASVARAGYLGSMDLVSGAFIAAVAVAAGIMASSGAMTVGQLITVVAVTQFVMGPLQAFAANFGVIWAGALASAQRVATVLQAPPAVRDSPSTGAAHGVDLALRGVRCGGGDVADVEIAEGEFVAVVAEPAAARALAEVLAGSAEPDCGTVTVGGAEIHRLSSTERRSRLLVVPHESDLFEGTVLENISRSTMLPGDSLDRALFAAACEDLVHALPDGLNTDVGEAGRLLSGGQRQRVSLARALAADPPILVLQDPTTSVDSVTEALIAQRMVEMRRGRTTVVISSSPNLWAVASTVLHLESAQSVIDMSHQQQDLEVSS